jgi:hypothetical protein
MAGLKPNSQRAMVCYGYKRAGRRGGLFSQGSGAAGRGTLVYLLS